MSHTTTTGENPVKTPHPYTSGTAQRLRSHVNKVDRDIKVSYLYHFFTLILRAGGFGPETRHIHGVTTYAAKQYSQRGRATQGREPTNHEGKIRNQACAGKTRSRVTRTPLAKGGEWLLKEEGVILKEFDPCLAKVMLLLFVRRWQR